MRSYKIKPTKPKFGRVELPVDQLLAIYARQSRKEQLDDNPESFIQQTQRLRELAVEFGWKSENILPTFLENEQGDRKIVSASSAKRMDLRPVLQSLVATIERDEVKAVLVWLVDRLFRDTDRTDAGAFARTCREHGCIVLT